MELCSNIFSVNNSFKQFILKDTTLKHNKNNIIQLMIQLIYLIQRSQHLENQEDVQ